MIKKILSPIVAVTVGILWISSYSYGQEKTTTTVIEETQTKVVPAPKPKPIRRAKKAVRVEDTSTTIITTTTTPPPPPAPEVARRSYDEDQLKKMVKTLCTDGFEAHVGSDKQNMCLGRANPPDVAYSCWWKKKGPPVFQSNKQGPCNLDFTEHRGNATLGDKQAECCFRAAKGPATASQ